MDLETTRKILDHALNIKIENDEDNEINRQLDKLLSCFKIEHDHQIALDAEKIINFYINFSKAYPEMSVTYIKDYFEHYNMDDLKKLTFVKHFIKLVQLNRSFPRQIFDLSIKNIINYDGLYDECKTLLNHSFFDIKFESVLERLLKHLPEDIDMLNEFINSLEDKNSFMTKSKDKIQIRLKWMEEKIKKEIPKHIKLFLYLKILHYLNGMYKGELKTTIDEKTLFQEIDKLIDNLHTEDNVKVKQILKSFALNDISSLIDDMFDNKEYKKVIRLFKLIDVESVDDIPKNNPQLQVKYLTSYLRCLV